MPSEPNEKIEKLLKRYAGQRREASRGDDQLHPATRRLLQGEVARTFAKTDCAEGRSFHFQFWPRLAVGIVFTALVALTVIILNTPGQRRIQVAQSSLKENSSREPSRFVGDSKEISDAVRDRSALLKQEITASPLVAPPASELETTDSINSPVGQLGLTAKKMELNSAGNLSKDKISNGLSARSRGEAKAMKPQDEASLSTRLSGSGESQNRRQFVREDLHSKYRRNFLSPTQPKILETFELIQTGNQIRLRESDNSIYDGEILSATEAKSGIKEKQILSENSRFAFRVEGTNQQLNRLVTIVGQFAPEKSVILPKKSSSEARAQSKASETKSSPSAGWFEGKVSIGGTNEFEIRAVEILK